jgi:lipopolysaccharide/colanic/teichoic acid biosynthesis glycosyltransferase
MITQTTTCPSQSTTSSNPTIWGLTPAQVHDHFWAVRGVQVVRQGQRPELVEGAELFLLTDPRSLAIFRLRPLVEPLSWLRPDVMWVRLHDTRERGYREQAISDGDGRFLRFERAYGGSDSRLARLALTSSRHIAEWWQSQDDPRTGWQQLRRAIPPDARAAATVHGSVYDQNLETEVMQFLRDLVQRWKHPEAVISRARRHGTDVWVDDEAKVDRHTRFVGSVWVGAGRQLDSQTTVIGPAVLWDDPDARPQSETVNWADLEPKVAFDRPVRRRLESTVHRRAKRAFDIMVASVVLLCALPLFPFIMLAIWLEDGRPFFFAHQRETVGGREFPCLKFRSMRKDAEQIKAELAAKNQSDGPQFFIEDDPRLTRVGRFIRKFHLDELPQLINVLQGDMSIVGPRPSPYKENQYCPAWREARLSVRPGMTGMWQVCRTRQAGLDFQEWIRYDIEYVERASFWLDLWIIWRTATQIISRK